MPDLATRFGGPCFDVSSVPASSRGVLVSGDASPHTKGVWTEVIAATTAPSAWLLLIVRGESGINLVDIGYGASTAEAVLIPNLVAATQNSTSSIGIPYLLPLGIPAGTRISARSQSVLGADNTFINAHIFAPTLDGMRSLTRVEACGITEGTTSLTQIDPGGTAHTDSGWVELIATTSFAYRWLLFAPMYRFDATGTANRALVDLAVGGSGSEVAFMNDIEITMGTAVDGMLPCLGFPVNIPAGSRISAQLRASLNTANERLIQIAVWGVG